MPKRFVEVDPATLNADQMAIYDAIVSGRRGTVPYIFQVLLRSPRLAELTQNLGLFCRYETDLPARLSELAILVVARHWQADYEWSVHEHEARKAGVPEDVIAALKADRVPDFSDPDDALVYRFSSAFFAHKDVPDDIYAAAEARFGSKAAVELAGVLGYYSMLAIVLRIYRVPPQGEA